MLFLEPWFWTFAAVAILGTWVCPARLRVLWLLAASLVFQYHFAGPAGVLPVAALALLTYAVGLRAAAGRGRREFAFAVVVLVGALVFYKYSLLAADTLGLRQGPLRGWRGPAVPLGISFFTFEFVHYLYEVHVRARAPVRNAAHFALFAVFFPSLAAGPIKRYPDFVPQLAQLRRPSASEGWSAVGRLVRGLFKKVCIADLLVVYIDALDGIPHQSVPTLAALCLLLGLRIYYDFSAYSDIAIALGQMVCLRLPENFDRPYRSCELRDFWRRWHMSLSSWIRDYVYVPLGGNRARRAFNLLLAMAVCGLWHGPAWNFALWGVYHGAGLATEDVVRRRWPGLFRGAGAARAGGWVICYGFVNAGWLLFFYPAPTAWRMVSEALRWGFRI